VTSAPAGATVFVDGKERGPTPATLSDLEAKKSYEVRISQKGFHDFKTTLVAKAGAKVQAKLVANEKVVEVSSTPAGADLFLDGKKVGKTPFTIHKLDVAKDHQLELRRGGFVSQSRKVGAGDAWDSQEGRDVLAVALTLEAEPPKAAKPAAKRVPGKKPEGESGEKPAATPAGEKPAETGEKPAETGEKPAAEKPAAEKPAAEKPAEKPVEKPAEKKEKPADEDKAIKTPAWMNKDKPAEGEAQ
jgi:hypothetical protein